MPRIIWDATGDHVYERGIDRGVLYVDGSIGVPWNGLVSVSEKPSGGDPQPYYIDGEKFYQESASEDFAATISAFTYPDEFDSCEGIGSYNKGLLVTAQPRTQFGIVYRTLIGNDISTDQGYKIHLVYNAMVAPTQRNNDTESEQVNPLLFSWDIQTVPVQVIGFKSTSHIVIDSRTVKGLALSAIEDILYGNSVDDPRLPTVAELSTVIDSYDDLIVTDNGDGTATISGIGVTMIDANTYTINWLSVIQLDTNTYSVSSL